MRTGCRVLTMNGGTSRLSVQNDSTSWPIFIRFAEVEEARMEADDARTPADMCPHGASMGGTVRRSAGKTGFGDDVRGDTIQVRVATSLISLGVAGSGTKMSTNPETDSSDHEWPH